MKFTLTIDDNGAALVDGHPDELGRLVEQVGRRIRGGVIPSTVLDANGNVVGSTTFEPGDSPICGECGERYDEGMGTPDPATDEDVCPRCAVVLDL